jgi:excisionase family DNA binding protein
MLKEQKIVAQDYPIIVSRLADHIRFSSVEFGIELLEKAFLASREDQCAQIAIGIFRMQEKIARHIKAQLASGLPCPAPRKIASLLLSANSSNQITLAEAARILGEPLHSVRRMADRGELTVTRTRRGHRRFSRAQVERLANGHG